MLAAKGDCTCPHSLEGRTLRLALRVVFLAAVAQFLLKEVERGPVAVVRSGVMALLSIM